jgi:hypothetical protein
MIFQGTTVRRMIGSLLDGNPSRVKRTDGLSIPTSVVEFTLVDCPVWQMTNRWRRSSFDWLLFIDGESSSGGSMKDPDTRSRFQSRHSADCDLLVRHVLSLAYGSGKKSVIANTQYPPGAWEAMHILDCGVLLRRPSLGVVSRTWSSSMITEPNRPQDPATASSSELILAVCNVLSFFGRNSHRAWSMTFRHFKSRAIIIMDRGHVRVTSSRSQRLKGSSCV